MKRLTLILALTGCTLHCPTPAQAPGPNHGSSCSVSTQTPAPGEVCVDLTHSTDPNGVPFGETFCGSRREAMEWVGRKR